MTSIPERRQGLDSFYALLADLDVVCGGKRRLLDCDGRAGWPRRGVYFFFEDGEVRADGATPRVVRVGTHALRPSKSTLWGRLSQHKGLTAGSMPGGGNHRGSVFRLHVGKALLAATGWPESIRKTWAVGSSAPPPIRSNEYPLEREVSARIGRMPFLWLEIDDPPGPASDRGVIESGAISLLSNRDRPPLDPASGAWLGRRVENESIRTSGLWNVDGVGKPPETLFLRVLRLRIEEFARKRGAAGA